MKLGIEVEDDVAPPQAAAPSVDAPNACPDCGKTFDSLSGMRRHRTVTHGVSEPKADKAPRARSVAGSRSLQADLHNLVTSIGSMLMFVNQVDGTIVVGNAEAFSTAWANLAQKNEGVRRFLTALTTGSAYSEVVMACVAMALPIAANHGKLPESLAKMLVPSG